jgi:hypothetical protein
MDGKVKMFSVCLWESHPDNGNDDCSTGEDFATEAEARACLANLDGTFNMRYYRLSPFIELDGPGVYEVLERPGVVARRKREFRDDFNAERHENAMMAGMAFGCQGYNDAMGW